MDPGSAIFVRHNTDEIDDVWDDSSVIRTWDKSLNAFKKRMFSSFEKDESRRVDVSTEDSDGVVSDGTVPPKDGQCNGSLSNSENGNNKSSCKKNNMKSQKYKVGDNVRAPYSLDGREYEAVINKLLPWKQSCYVKFVGYGNKEEVLLSDLKESFGFEAVNNQMLQSRMEGAEDSDTFSNFEEEETRMETEHGEDQFKKPTRNVNLTQPKQNIQVPRNNMFNMPHQPQMSAYMRRSQPSASGPLPHITPPVLNTMKHQPHSEHEAYTSMLMSWYFNGYHTGYYEGLKHGQEMSKTLSHGNVNCSCAHKK